MISKDKSVPKNMKICKVFGQKLYRLSWTNLDKLGQIDQEITKFLEIVLTAIKEYVIY
jgi:hypothetical protein